LISINAKFWSTCASAQRVNFQDEMRTRNMYKNIIIPVDLTHQEGLAKALAVGADLAKHYDAKITAVSVTSNAPTSIAHNPSEFGQVLAKFANEQSQALGVQFSAKAMTSPDPTIDIDDALNKAASELKCDLVIMASHVPGFSEHIFASRAGYLASHSEISVLVVR
jgi:nucleotide-binding universal stress UspA family protein